MRKLSILFLAVCILAAGCKNKVTSNISSVDMRAMKTIAEDGGTPDSSPEGIADFLSSSDYQGVFATEFGRVGYKIKNSKISFNRKSRRKDWQMDGNHGRNRRWQKSKQVGISNGKRFGNSYFWRFRLSLL